MLAIHNKPSRRNLQPLPKQKKNPVEGMLETKSVPSQKVPFTGVDGAEFPDRSGCYDDNEMKERWVL